MTIEKTVNGTTAEWKPIGWLDLQNAPAMEAELNALDPGITALVIDCAGLEYISSAGLRQLVAAYKKMNGEVTLKNVSDEIMNVISMTGLDKRLKII